MTQYAPDTEGGSTTEQVKEQMGEKAQVAQDKARGAAGQARSRLRDQVDQRSTQAGERLSGTAADVRSVAEELRRQGKEAPARMVEQAAGQADRVALLPGQARGNARTASTRRCWSGKSRVWGRVANAGRGG